MKFQQDSNNYIKLYKKLCQINEIIPESYRQFELIDPVNA